jgi:hypothetical protein
MHFGVVFLIRFFTLIIMTRFLIGFIIISLVFSGCNNQQPLQGEIAIESDADYAIFPRPRNPLKTRNNEVGFYNEGTKSFQLFSLETGNPLKKLALGKLPLAEMYKQINSHYQNKIELTPFDSVYGEVLSDQRSITSYGLFKTVDNNLYGIIKLPYEYRDPEFFYEGRYVKATIRKSQNFLITLDDSLNLREYFLIDETGLPDMAAFYFHSQNIFTGKDLIVPLVMDPFDFESFESDIPAYGHLVFSNGKLIVKGTHYTKNRNWFRYLGNVAVITSFYPTITPDGKYCIALGNQVFKLDNYAMKLEDEVLFEFPECERISYIKIYNETLYYVCGDLIFEKNSLLDSMVNVRTSKGDIFVQINPHFTVQPFYYNDYMYLFETNEDFSKTVLKYFRLN